MNPKTKLIISSVILILSFMNVLYSATLLSTVIHIVVLCCYMIMLRDVLIDIGFVPIQENITQ